MDVHDPARGLFGRCEAKISNQAFDALVEQVMTSEPYASARQDLHTLLDRLDQRGRLTPAA